MKVGDIVICHGWPPTEGKKGFIDEINQFGQFSIFGFEEIDEPVGSKLFYGEYFKDEIEPYQGLSLDKEKLEKHLNDFVRPKDKIKKIIDEFELITIENTRSAESIRRSALNANLDAETKAFDRGGSDALRDFYNGPSLRKRKLLQEGKKIIWKFPTTKFFPAVAK